jgi:GDSL/SGNH-like Acyl-Esterase family found in Pmr5 and Cas1p
MQQELGSISTIQNANSSMLLKQNFRLSLSRWTFFWCVMLLTFLLIPLALCASCCAEDQCTQTKQLCYSSSQSPLQYIPLQVPFNSDPPPEFQHVYFNLSCPWEANKFSCAHQGQHEKARVASYFGQQLETSDCRLSPFNGRLLLQLLDKRQMIFTGDSITRQMFMSMACLLYSSPNVKLVRDDVQWLVSTYALLFIKVRSIHCIEISSQYKTSTEASHFETFTI